MRKDPVPTAKDAEWASVPFGTGVEDLSADRPARSDYAIGAQYPRIFIEFSLHESFRIYESIIV